MDHTRNLRERVEALEDHVHKVERRLRWWRGIACSAVMLTLWGGTLPSSTAKSANQGNSAFAGNLEGRLAALEYKLRYVTGGANEVVITGANLRIVNGLGVTESVNGFGNLIVGYNESRDPEVPFLSPENRTGSHNVVIGREHNFASFGGLVVGLQNEIAGQFSSVSGGLLNSASGDHASVTGGSSNTASGIEASVSGGFRNTARGIGSSVSGGDSNIADSFDSSIGGGFQNVASGIVSSVSGGLGGTASATAASISGGVGNVASGGASSVSGGAHNTASGDFSAVSGGHNRSAPQQSSWAAGPLFFDDF